MSTGIAVAVGAVAGLGLGIIVSVTTDVPLAPEMGLVVGAVVGWLSHRWLGQSSHQPMSETVIGILGLSGGRSSCRTSRVWPPMPNPGRLGPRQLTWSLWLVATGIALLA